MSTIQLRRVGAEDGEQADEPRVACCPCSTRLSVWPLQLVEADVAAVLDLQLEAAGGAQALDRRGAEHVITAASGISRQQVSRSLAAIAAS